MIPATEIDKTAKLTACADDDRERLLRMVLHDAARLDDVLVNASIRALGRYVGRSVDDWVSATEALDWAGR